MRLYTVLKKFLSNKSGNVAMIFGISLLLIMLSVGAAVDYSRASNLNIRVAQATDAALLAATAHVMQNADLDDQAAVNTMLTQQFGPFFLANMINVDGFQYNGFTINYDMATRNVTVDMDVDYQTAVLGIIGKDSLEMTISAATGMQVNGGGAISMFLVLDRSGSMGWSNGDGGSKMDSLQAAVNGMIGNIKVSDPDEEYIRMGAVAYSSNMWSVQPLEWQLDGSNIYVQAMTSGGGTDSSSAVNEAYQRLKKPAEQSLHMSKNGQVPDLIMVFMTDGDNNNPADDTATINTCNQAKAYGMEIYTVAFQAPSSGQALLSNCATDAAHYFEPENTAELIEAFSFIGASTVEKLVLSQ